MRKTRSTRGILAVREWVKGLLDYKSLAGPVYIQRERVMTNFISHDVMSKSDLWTTGVNR